MSQTTSTGTTYMNEVIALLNPIAFDTSANAANTLQSLGLIKPFQLSIQNTPNTEINVFCLPPPTQWLDSHENIRTYPIMVRVRCLAVAETTVNDNGKIVPKTVGREAIAQEDLQYLVEQILLVIESNYNSSVWGAGYLDNTNINSVPRNYRDNYYTVEIMIPIKQRVPEIS